MFASKTKSVLRYEPGNFGWKFSKTFSAIERVSRVFKSQEYSPDQRKVFPFTRCTPSLSILRDFQNSNSDSGKSSPTTPTRRTGEKKLAATAAYEAEPPNKLECSSTGVLTASSAMEPTTKTDIRDQRSAIRSFLQARAYSAMSGVLSKPDTIATRRAPAAITCSRLSILIPPMQKIGRATSRC